MEEYGGARLGRALKPLPEELGLAAVADESHCRQVPEWRGDVLTKRVVSRRE